MEFNLKNFCSYIDELVRYKKELEVIIRGYGKVEVTNDNKIYVFIDYTNFNDFALTYWGVNPKLEGEFVTANHKYFTWINNAAAYSTKELTKALTERIEQLIDNMEFLNTYFDDVKIDFLLGERSTVVIKTNDKDKVKKLLKVKEDSFDWQNANDTFAVYIQ